MYNWTRLGQTIQRKKGALIVSVQHTGTWFAIEFLRRHPSLRSGEFIELSEVFKHKMISPYPLIHTHLGGSTQIEYPERVNKFISRDDFIEFIQIPTTVVPVRDPLLSLITRHKRHPMLDHRYIVDGFLTLAEVEDLVTFLRVDCPRDDRRSELGKVSALFEPGPDHVKHYLDREARQWVVRNSVGGGPLNISYQQGMFDEIMDEIREELTYLLEHRSTIVPFLQRRGYRELSWWNL